MPWEEGQEFIRSGHRDPDEFEPDSLPTISLSKEEGIKAVIGKTKGKDVTEIQSYLFLKDKWTLEKAKAWFRQHEAKAKESLSWVGSIKGLPGATNPIRGKPRSTKQNVSHAGVTRGPRIPRRGDPKIRHSPADKPLVLHHIWTQIKGGL